MDNHNCDHNNNKQTDNGLVVGKVFMLLTQEGTMVMVEASASGPCQGSGGGDVAARELTTASGSSYSGSCPPDTVERYMVKWVG